MSYNSVDAAVERCIDSYLDNYDFNSIIEAVLEDDNIPSKDDIDIVQDLAQECESRIDKLETKLERSFSILEKIILHPSFSLSEQLKVSILEEIKTILED